MLLGAVGVVVRLVDRIGNVRIDDEGTGHVDIQHLHSANESACLTDTHLFEVWNRLCHIVRPRPLDSYAGAVNASFEIAERLDNIRDRRLDRLGVGDVYPVVLCLVGRYPLGECIALVRIDHIEKRD